ncbi:hypothetical protein QJS04_geneDACA018000 [Acorus gramineus]|uniref:Uncharacterized protein n=1 Tax=Acorus gramineus TaxID=55184 RepID=A0AAV9A0T3_ACOGR|nr:hypothetical protein QJS04_geneDACA018000 [Acorus gramineus]
MLIVSATCGTWRYSATDEVPRGAPPSDPTQMALKKNIVRGVSHTLSERHNPCITDNIYHNSIIIQPLRHNNMIQ